MFTVLFHSLLIGVALFVPIPLLDDRLARFFWRRMITDLAQDHKKNLTKEQIDVLTYQSHFALGDGCMFFLRRLFREFFQEILFFLEWRKAINLASDAYYSGYLLNELFAYEGFDEAKIPQYAIALQKAKQGVNMQLVQGVFRSQFRSSKGVLMSVTKWLSGITIGYAKTSWTRWKKRKNPDNASEEKMENFFEMHKSRFQELLKDLIHNLQSGIGSLPREHFDQLRNRLFEELQQMETPAI